MDNVRILIDNALSGNKEDLTQLFSHPDFGVRLRGFIRIIENIIDEKDKLSDILIESTYDLVSRRIDQAHCDNENENQ